MATRKGLEPSTSSVTGWHSKPTELPGHLLSGNNRARTCDPLLVRQMLSQLSYAPPLLRNGFPRGTDDIITDHRTFVNIFFKIMHGSRMNREYDFFEISIIIGTVSSSSGDR